MCPACDSPASRTLFQATDRLYHTTDRVFHVVECAACKLIRLSPWPDVRELGQFYPPEYWFVPEQDATSRLEEFYRRAVLRDHIRFVLKAIENSGLEQGLVLDCGCGGGLFLKMLAERGYPVAGLDFSLAAATVAWRQNGVPVVCGKLNAAPFAPGSCAAVTMFHVLEHLYDPASYLDAAHRLLAPEGRLVIQVPNAASWQFLLLGENWRGIDVPRHLFDFRAADIEILLDRCGFEIVRLKHFSLRDSPASLATSLAPGLDPMVRRVRAVDETPRTKLLKDLLYLGLVAASLPFTLLEAACGAGAMLMVEARKKR